MKNKSEKGITLIALIITIIVLLILFLQEHLVKLLLWKCH